MSDMSNGYPSIDDHAFEFTSKDDEREQGKQIIRDTFAGITNGSLKTVTYAAWRDGDTSGDATWGDADQPDDWGMRMGRPYILNDGRLYMPLSGGWLTDSDVLTKDEQKRLRAWVEDNLGGDE